MNYLHFNKNSLYPDEYRKDVDKESKRILLREAKAINAEVSWWKSRNMIYIEVQAPTSFVWASTREHTLTHECPYNQSQEIVAELLKLMEQGFIQDLKAKHDHDCECDTCENSVEDELVELDF